MIEISVLRGVTSFLETGVKVIERSGSVIRQALA